MTLTPDHWFPSLSQEPPETLSCSYNMHICTLTPVFATDYHVDYVETLYNRIHLCRTKQQRNTCNKPEALQVRRLLLPPSNRRPLQLLLRLTAQVCQNPLQPLHSCLHSGRPFRQLFDTNSSSISPIYKSQIRPLENPTKKHSNLKGQCVRNEQCAADISSSL